MIDNSRPSSTRSRDTITLNRGDSFNLNTGGVIRNDTTEPVPATRETALDGMLRRNNLLALSLYFRNKSLR